jgi:hypothetical protein
MASRRSVCPRCGAPVGVPALKPHHPGAEGPMTPQERLRRERKLPLAPALERDAPPAEGPAAVAAAPLLSTYVVRLLSDKDKRAPDPAGRHLEEHWYECLQYPLRAWPFCLGLAFYLAAFSAGGVLLPHLIVGREGNPISLAFVTLGVLLVIGLPCSFLDCVLGSAVQGEVYYIRWSGNPLLTYLLSGARWLACFLAGPVVFAAAGFVYWLRCGEPKVVDWLILLELGVVAVAWQVFALLSVADRRRLRGLNLVAVVDLAHRLGGRALGVVVAAAALFLAHGWTLAAGTTQVHTAPLKGWAILAGAWASGVFWGTFFCRLLGVWCHRSRVAVPT